LSLTSLSNVLDCCWLSAQRSVPDVFIEYRDARWAPKEVAANSPVATASDAWSRLSRGALLFKDDDGRVAVVVCEDAFDLALGQTSHNLVSSIGVSEGSTARKPRHCM
jgi:hypothetical protein